MTLKHRDGLTGHPYKGIPVMISVVSWKIPHFSPHPTSRYSKPCYKRKGKFQFIKICSAQISDFKIDFNVLLAIKSELYIY